MHRFRYPDTANRGKRLQPGSNIYAISKHIIVFKYNITQVYANP